MLDLVVAILGRVRSGLQSKWQRWAEKTKLPREPILEDIVKTLSSAMSDNETLSQTLSLHARNRGQAGRPSSELATPLGRLASFLERQRPDQAEFVWSLLSIAVDAHVVGALSRSHYQWMRQLQELTPLLVLPSGEILLCPVGPLPPEHLDALMHRALVLSIQAEATIIYFEISYISELDESLLLATLSGFTRHELAGKVSIVILGAPPEAKWPDELKKREIPEHIVRCVTKPSASNPVNQA